MTTDGSTDEGWGEANTAYRAASCDHSTPLVDTERVMLPAGSTGWKHSTWL